MDKNLFSSIEETLLVEVFTHKLRKGKTRVLTLGRIQEDLSRKITGVLDECSVKLVFIDLKEATFIVNGGLVHVHPPFEQIFEIASTSSLLMEIIGSNFFTCGSCKSATPIVVASHFKWLTERLLSFHKSHH
jgi:hypothetical protein